MTGPGSHDGTGRGDLGRDRLPEAPRPDEARSVLALDGDPLTCTVPHAGRIDRLPGTVSGRWAS